MSFIWTQTRFGKAFPLVNPDPALVDFKEIALTLAELPRYAGNFEKPISVAQHTLIALDACMAADGTALDRAYVLIHDAHEAYMGDITAPVAEALAAIAGETGEAHSRAAKWVVRNAIDGLKARLDAAIHTAAGLPLPDPKRRERIRVADLAALQTERRDFLARSPKPWSKMIEAAQPLKKTYRLRPPADIAEDLHKLFKTYLPALQRKVA